MYYLLFLVLLILITYYLKKYENIEKFKENRECKKVRLSNSYKLYPKIKTLDKNIVIYNNNFKKLKNHVEMVHNLLIKIRKLSDKK